MLCQFTRTGIEEAPTRWSSGIGQTLAQRGMYMMDGQMEAGKNGGATAFLAPTGGVRNEQAHNTF